MDVNQAVKVAKDWVKTVYDEEGLTQLGLEEVRYDEDEHQWRITLGFARPWNMPQTSSSGLAAALGAAVPLRRTFKVVAIDDRSGSVIALENRAEV